MSVARAVLSATVAATLLAGCTATDDDGGAPEEPVAADPLPAPDDVAAAEDDGTDADGTATDGAQADGDAADEPRTFAAGEDIPVEVSWLASDDGGRRTGVFGGYRGTLTFADHEPMVCTVGGPAEGGSMEPGSTHEVTATCPEDVTIAPDEVAFTVEEGGRLVGDGLVLP